MTECRCKNLKSLHGGEGEEYADSHLTVIAQNKDTWEMLYKCPTTGTYWKKFYPQAEAHGGGPPDYVKIKYKKALEEFDLNP